MDRVVGPMLRYRINEFTVESEIRLPFPTAPETDAAPDPAPALNIRRASLAEKPSLLRKIRRQLAYDVGDGFLIEPKIGVSLHLDLKGRVVTVDAADEALNLAIAWLIHAGFGGATLLRGGLPLHGAGLELGGKRFCLMADSGSGKSTLSWHLLRNGARFANDDLVPVYAGDSANDLPTAFPAVSLYPKLSRDVADRYGLDPATLLAADYGRGEEEYFASLAQEGRVVAPTPLAAIFLLRPTTCGCGADCACGGNCSCAAGGIAPGEVVPSRLTADEAAEALQSGLHAHWLIGKWLDGAKIRRQCRRLAGSVPVYTLSYNRSYDILPELERSIRLLLRQGYDGG